MEMKYYNASNNFSAPIPREPKPYHPPQKSVYKPTIHEEPPKEEQSVELPCNCQETSSEISHPARISFGKDDYLLLGLILILLMNGCDDWLLLIILGYLLITGRNH